MSLAPFDWVESASTSLDEQPRVKATRFGDGYEEREPDGLNPITQKWDVVFRDVDDDIATDMVEYFRAAAGVDSFGWTPLWHTAEIKVVARSWRRTQSDTWGKSDITAVFEQVFEP